MTTVIAVCSLILAFGALWFTSEVVKRIDNRTNSVITPQLHKALSAAGRADQAIDGLIKRLQVIEGQIQELKRSDRKPAGLSDIERQAAAITAALRENRRFAPMPAQYQLNG
jgi:hypothetical protein